MRKTLFMLVFLLLLFGCLELQQFQNSKLEGVQSDSILEKAFVESVIDGDTIVLSSGEKVRLIGINAPEKGEPCFDQALNVLKLLVEDKNVSLMKDVSQRDRFGRLLRYVFVKDLFVNKFLVEEGFAFAFRYEPDVLYSEAFAKAEHSAMLSRKGCLWKE